MSNDTKALVEKLSAKYLPEIIRATPNVIARFKHSGNLYRYLATQIPILVDEQLPPALESYMEKMDTPATFTGDYIGFSTRRAAKVVAEGAVYLASQAGEDPNDYIMHASREVQTILAHEFTHILCDHIAQEQAHGKHFKDKYSYRLAEEIQANRGYMVDAGSWVYAMGITDEYYKDKIPELPTARTLPNIYQAIKNSLGDKVDEIAKQPESQQQQSQEQKQGEQNEEQPNENNKGGKSNENSQKEEGNGQPNNSPANQQTDQSENSGKPEGRSTEKNQGESQGSTGGQEQADNQGELSQEQQRRIQKMAKQMENDHTPETSVEQMLGIKPQEPGKEGENKQTIEVPEYDNSDGDTQPTSGQGSPFGMGGMGSGPLGDTPEEMLKNLNEKMDKKNIEKALARLRSEIKGNVSKGRTKSYSRPPRRTLEGDLMKKGIKKDARFNPSILVALDKSGSMDCTKVTAVATAVDNIVKQLGRDISNCYICLHDGTVKECQKLGNWKDVVRRYYASGGNQFSEVYRQAQRLGCDVVLNVGDGLDEITSNRVSHSKKQVFGGKQITWFDVIVSQLGGYSSHYWTARGIDEKHGVKRIPLDICGGLTPLEQCDKKTIEDYIRRNDEW